MKSTYQVIIFGLILFGSVNCKKKEKEIKIETPTWLQGEWVDSLQQAGTFETPDTYVITGDNIRRWDTNGNPDLNFKEKYKLKNQSASDSKYLIETTSFIDWTFTKRSEVSFSVYVSGAYPTTFTRK